MRSFHRIVAVTLTLSGFGLVSGWAQANVFLLGTAAGMPGNEVVLSIAVTPGTTLKAIDLLPFYEDFSAVLRLVDFQETSALTAGGTGQCINDLCSYFYLPGKFFEQQAVLATWRFEVTDNAEDFVDAKSGGRVPFDLGVFLGPEHALLPQDQVFTVLAASVVAVPEPSTFSLTVLGVSLLLIAGRYGSRRLASQERREAQRRPIPRIVSS